MDPIDVRLDGDVFAVINKPPGLPTQAPSEFDSLERRVREQFKARGDYVAFPHRLDRPVGGVIIVAFRKKAARLLSAQFESRKVSKTYLAQLEGKVAMKSSRWIDHLRKVPDLAKVEIAEADADDAKLAETQVHPIQFSSRHDRTLVKLSPITGRMHQLRIQAAHRGTPIVGDQQYGAKQPFVDFSNLEQTANRTGTLGSSNGDRLPIDAESIPRPPIALCAHEIRFFDPRDSRSVAVTIENRWSEELSSQGEAEKMT
ncbi:RNA pseudouridine synthase [bacterium]|nr:RNA pseudouridine synthase [bacterium]